MKIKRSLRAYIFVSDVSEASKRKRVFITHINFYGIMIRSGMR